MTSTRLLLILRLALGLLFLAAGLAKVFALDVTAALVADKGIPYAGTVALAVGAAEAFAGVLLLAGARTRAVAQALIALVACVALVFHDPIGLPPGVAHTNAVSLTIDVMVLLGLAFLVRRSPPAPRIVTNA
jgi:uncharacterized membrane protein YphA (DoxX/SURF4 family)